MRKNLICILALCALLLGAATSAAAQQIPLNGVAGVQPGMHKDKVRQVLAEIGRQKTGLDTKQEVWEVRDPQLSHVLVRLGRDGVVRNVTGRALEADSKDRRRMRYADVGDLSLSRLQRDKNNYTYTWRVKAKGSEPGRIVVARGKEPEHLTSYTVYRIVDIPDKN